MAVQSGVGVLGARLSLAATNDPASMIDDRIAAASLSRSKEPLTSGGSRMSRDMLGGFPLSGKGPPIFAILVLITSPSVDIWMAQEKTQAPFIYSVFGVFCRLTEGEKRDGNSSTEQNQRSKRRHGEFHIVLRGDCMLLKKSFVYRNSAHYGQATSINANSSVPPTGNKDAGVELGFDMGTEEKRERLAVHIHKSDFAAIAEQLAEADREAAIQAFAKALIKSRQT